MRRQGIINVEITMYKGLYLRFIWHEDNCFEKLLVDYQMKVHVFGNSPSPSIATYGLRRTADQAESKFGSDVKAFVHRNFYVDDARGSNRLLIEDNTPRRVKGLSSIVTLNVNSSECKFQHTPKLRKIL
jgi:hypothetical protein